MLPLLLLLPSMALAQKLSPPDSDPTPTCNKKVCARRRVRVKVYVDDRLWEQYAGWRQQRQRGGGQSLDERVAGVLDGINNHLARLDNGGFEVVIDGPATKISKSDVSLADTFIDRNDRNRTKKFSPDNIVAQTFAFQEAVFKLPSALKKEVNLRILFMREGPHVSLGTAEEMCICDQHPVFNYGCVAIFAIRHLSQWTFHTSIFAHELGHALGAAEHDDKHYRHSSGNRLLMWSQVGMNNLF